MGAHPYYYSVKYQQNVYFTLFKDGRPNELFFAGYSFD